MYCRKCGNVIDENMKFCKQCGTKIERKEDTFNNKKVVSFFICLCGVMLIIVGFALYNKQKETYYYSKGEETPELTENKEEEKQEEQPIHNKSKNQTVIVADNVYTGTNFSTKEDAISLIEKDSLSQKKTCPKTITKIENNIIKKYGIYAVNLCEMDENFASELENTIETIYNSYPKVRGYLTNITLKNVSMKENYIAAFGPYNPFAYSKDYNSSPMVSKTEIFLNSKYFLNPEYIDSSVRSSSSQGWFPKNATRDSPVAHELGHYLSFLAMMGEHNMKQVLIQTDENFQDFYDLMQDFVSGDFSLKMIKEAYQNYKNDHKDYKEDFDTFRGSISQYALAKDNNNEYIYDETIAEAFHDVYLNKDQAVDASKYIEAVLKKYLNKVGE